jgi:transcriptional regulator with XRE-family HTH domain
MSQLGDRLRIARERANLKQTQVKERTGIHNKTLSGYENGVSEPDSQTLATLAELYDVTTDFLLGLTNDPQGKAVQQNDSISPEEREFLRWIEENLESSFFYDFDKSPEESKREMMETLRFIWEREKRRRPGQKQGE